MKRLTLGSLFDGIGGFLLAAQRCGIKTVWASEIEPTCISITKRHFPDVIHLGDITKLHGGKIPPVDIISFGSPCQDLSCAGNQKGLAGERSGLFLEAVRIVYEMRRATHGRYPGFIIWENVPGAFNSNGGRDFRTVLAEITKTDIPMPKSGRWAAAGMAGGCAGGANIAWRQLDSQFWGVPQRRKRIFLVGDFRGNRAAQILFECESVLRYVEKSGKTGQEVTADTGSGIALSSNTEIAAFMAGQGSKAGSIAYNENVSPTIKSGASGGNQVPSLMIAEKESVNTLLFDEANITSKTNASNPQMNNPSHTLAATNAGRAILLEIDRVESVFDFGRSGDRVQINPQKSVALKATSGGGAAATGLYLIPKIYPINDGSVHGNANGLGFGEESETAPTLTASDRHGIAVCFSPGGFGEYTESKKNAGTLRASAGTHGHSSANLIAQCFNENGYGNYAEGVGPLRAHRTDKANQVVIFEQAAMFIKYILRKLTPLECERLQGFPDYWTKYAATGAKIADTPRYTALGNSLTVPCAERVFRGIVAVVNGSACMNVKT